MIGVIRSELVRLWRPRLLAGWFGLTAVFAVMINTILYSSAESLGAGPAVGPGATFPGLEALEQADGVVAGLSSASTLFGVITLAFWAVSAAGDYQSGLIRLLVSAHPQRWRLLAGKVIALAATTALATTVALVVNVAVAGPAAEAAGVSTAAWDLPASMVSAWTNAYAALLVWGVLGLVVAVLARSSAVAISLGIGYVLVVESIVTMALDNGSEWLLGSTLSALAAGGSAAMDYSTAGGLAVAYVGVGLAVATLVFTRRDVTD
ncbi:MAG: ABC transporter permease subunit [Acidimicrobiia bacterium]